MKFFTYFLLLMINSFVSIGQQINDDCSNAVFLCNGITIQQSNNNASIDKTPNGDDGDGSNINCNVDTDFSVWYFFETNNLGGSTSIKINNINCLAESSRSNELFAYVIEAGSPCNASTYSTIDACKKNNNLIEFNLTGLLPNKIYYLSIAGDKSLPATDAARCNFSININGPATELNKSNPIISSYPLSGICDYNTATYQISKNITKYNYLYSWYANDTFIESTLTDSLSTNNLPAGEIKIHAQVEAYYNDCKLTESTPEITTLIIDVNVNAGEDKDIIMGESISLNGSANGAFYWTPTNYLSDSLSLNPFLSPSSTIIYTLTSTYQGCSESDNVKISVSNFINIPDAITPNNDGFNDIWILDGIENYISNRVEIFNRWGQKVYAIDGYSNKNAWTAEYNNKILPSGTYIYVITLNNDSDDIYKGTINVIY